MIQEQIKGEVHVVTFRCDVSEKESITQAGQIARQVFGEVTVLINNAGIVSGKSILENSDFMMKKTLEVNTLAHLYTIREFLPDMIRIKKGHIVSIASVAGLQGSPGLADYAASKFGAVAIDESLRTELKKQGLYKYIKTTCINPFFINTGMFDGVKDNWSFFRILDQHYVVWRILTAIRQNEDVVVMPFNCNVIYFLKALFPVWLSDRIGYYAGGHHYMDTFKGRLHPSNK